MKSLLYTLLSFLGLGIAFIAGYLSVHSEFFLTSPTTALIGFSRPQATPLDLPDTPVHFLPLIDRQVTALQSSSGSLRYFEKTSGRLFSLDLSTGRESSLRDHIVPDFRGASWSRQGNRLLVRSGEAFFVFTDATHASETPRRLSPTTRSAGFSPSGDTLAEFQIIGGVGSVVLSPPTLDFPVRIFETRLLDSEVLWISNDQLLLVTRTADDLFTLMLLNRTGHIIDILETQHTPFIQPSPGGLSFLYTILQKNGEPSVASYDLAQGTSRTLLSSALSSKCAWLEETRVLCGFSSVTNGQGTDTLQEIDLSEGQRTFSHRFENMIVQSISVLPGASTLIVVNALDHRMYSLPIHPSQ